jgi:hypothetical protein
LNREIEFKQYCIYGDETAMVIMITGAVKRLTFSFDKLQVKKFLSTILLGFLLLVTNINPDISDKSAIDRLSGMIHQDKDERPKTTLEWNQQARETKGKPVEKLKRIGKQSAEAVKDFASTYPDVARKSADELNNNNRTNR